MATTVAATVDQRQALVGQRMGQTRFGDGHREGTEGGVGQRDGGTTAQATVEGIDGGVQGHACDQAAGNGADNQGNNNVNAAQAQHEHDQHRGNNGIHGELRVGIVVLPVPCGHRQFEKRANLP